MKSKTFTLITAMTLLTALATPIRLAAQNNRDHHHEHHHYKLIDLGTLGGPQSFGDGFHGAGNISNRGVAAGVADTSASDPYYPNFNPLGFFQDPFVHHAFLSKNGNLVDLGAFPGANSSSVSFVNENGLASGQSLNGTIDPLTGWPEQNAVLWKDGQIINLGTLGGYESGAGVVNSHAQIAGFSGNAVPDPNSLLGLGTQTRAFLWDDDHGMQDLGTLGGPDAFAFAVNDRGQVAGFSYTSSLAVDPFIWESGKITDLGTFGGTFGVPSDLNNSGQVVGQSNLAGDAVFHPFLWTKPGPMRDLGTLGGDTGSANAISDAGEVVGGSDVQGNQTPHAFLWAQGVMRNLGTVGGSDCSSAFGINSKGQVVGQSFDCANPLAGQRAFLWENGHIVDLNIFVPPRSNLTLIDVESINDCGEMFGSAVLLNGETHAFLLIPRDENHRGVEGCDYSLRRARQRKARHLATCLAGRSVCHCPGGAIGIAFPVSEPRNATSCCGN